MVRNLIVHGFFQELFLQQRVSIVNEKVDQNHLNFRQIRKYVLLMRGSDQKGHLRKWVTFVPVMCEFVHSILKACVA